MGISGIAISPLHHFGNVWQVEGEPLDPPKPLAWYPDKLAWHFAFSRAQLRKLSILKDVHELVIRENDAGAITRQEAVSMIPPLLLDVQPHHRVYSLNHVGLAV